MATTCPLRQRRHLRRRGSKPPGGGHSVRACDILVATPGRLEDLHNQGFIDVSQLEIFVLDEADRMLDMGFIHDVKKILSLAARQKADPVLLRHHAPGDLSSW